MTKPPVVQTIGGDWVVVKSTHQTKGAADKAANKARTTQEPTQEQEMVAFVHKSHPCDLEEPAPDNLTITFNNKAYSFHFYVNRSGRYVALTNTIGYQDIHGEGANWWMAANECMSKILKRKPSCGEPK